MLSPGSLPIAVIGAGPVGLAAAAHLIARHLPVRIYEAGPAVGFHMRDWGHVRVFTPWRYCLDPAAIALLERTGWRAPDANVFPTGSEIVARYLEPLAATPELAGVLETGVRVFAISRHGLDKVVSRRREHHPFELAIQAASGTRRDLARAVIDASGTWATPNPLGANGCPVDGEAECGERIAYGIPDVLGRHRAIYAGRTTLVVGSGHSAANALLDLARLSEAEPSTAFMWAVRSTELGRIFGGGDADQLPARGALGAETKKLFESRRRSFISGFSTTALHNDGGRIVVAGETEQGMQVIGPVDRIIAATGQRPDLSLTRELRLDLDPSLESTRALGPLIDPNEHSCGSVPPHGHRELAHPEPGFYTAGIKSYGRAPTFLLQTGYEQVRSIAAVLAGDSKAADDVRLVLPKTGLCTATFSVKADSAAGCCGGPAPSGTDACCLADAMAKIAGRNDCGCGSAA